MTQDKEKNIGLVYIAQPFTHNQKKTQTARVWAAEQALSYFVSQKCPAYSPIAHAAVAYRYAKGSHDYWRATNLCLLRRACSQMVVLQMPDWEKSKMLKEEIADAEEVGIPIFYSDYQKIRNGYLIPTEARPGMDKAINAWRAQMKLVYPDTQFV